MNLSAARAKRSLDLVVSVSALLLAAPVLLLAALAIRIESKGPVLHRERRVGLPRRDASTALASPGGSVASVPEERLFSLLRFRVLGHKEHSLGRRSGEHPRLTHVGRVLRRTGLEDWPQLLNVLLGQMSLVGPRAATPQCIERMTLECPAWRPCERGSRPGIFGFAQLDRPEGAGFFAAVCEKLLFDVIYDHRLRERGPVDAVLDDIALVAGSLERRFSSRARPVGTDVIRIDHPAYLSQVPLDPLLLARHAPLGLSADIVDQGDTVTSYWYLPRRRAGPVPVADLELLRALCDDVRCEGGQLLVLTKALRSSDVPSTDVIRLDLPTSLHELHSVCEHLQLLWEALASRSRDEHFSLGMTFVVVQALAAAARGLGGADGRLALSVRVAQRELRLSVEARPRQASRVGLPIHLTTA